MFFWNHPLRADGSILPVSALDATAANLFKAKFYINAERTEQRHMSLIEPTSSGQASCFQQRLYAHPEIQSPETWRREESPAVGNISPSMEPCPFVDHEKRRHRTNNRRLQMARGPHLRGRCLHHSQASRFRTFHRAMEPLHFVVLLPSVTSAYSNLIHRFAAKSGQVQRFDSARSFLAIATLSGHGHCVATSCLSI